MEYYVYIVWALAGISFIAWAGTLVEEKLDLAWCRKWRRLEAEKRN